MVISYSNKGDFLTIKALIFLTVEVKKKVTELISNRIKFIREVTVKSESIA